MYIIDYEKIKEGLKASDYLPEPETEIGEG